MASKVIKLKRLTESVLLEANEYYRRKVSEDISPLFDDEDGAIKDLMLAGKWTEAYNKATRRDEDNVLDAFLNHVFGYKEGTGDKTGLKNIEPFETELIQHNLKVLPLDRNPLVAFLEQYFEKDGPASTLSKEGYIVLHNLFSRRSISEEDLRLGPVFEILNNSDFLNASGNTKNAETILSIYKHIQTSYEPYNVSTLEEINKQRDATQQINYDNGGRVRTKEEREKLADAILFKPFTSKNLQLQLNSLRDIEDTLEDLATAEGYRGYQGIKISGTNTKLSRDDEVKYQTLLKDVKDSDIPSLLAFIQQHRLQDR